MDFMEQKFNNFEILAHNASAWDHQARQGSPWSQPVSQDVIAAAKQGVWQIYLTPQPLPSDWLGDVKGKKVLCLASAGGQQAPVLAAAGAEVTVFDLSEEQLNKDAMVARRDDLSIAIVHGDMCDLSSLPTGAFDYILHPISNQYVQDIKPVWHQCRRVLRKGGALMSSFFNPAIFIADRTHSTDDNDLIRLRFPTPYSDLTDLSPRELNEKIRRKEPFIFGHDLQSQIGAVLAAGFMMTHFFEERHPDPRFKIERYLPSFIATRSISV
jgi:2-polyprenyl-3-methyl-5-hydroxy-6-metoxy-1,4-benzoquinol methylase